MDVKERAELIFFRMKKSFGSLSIRSKGRWDSNMYSEIFCALFKFLIQWPFEFLYQPHPDFFKLNINPQAILYSVRPSNGTHEDSWRKGWILGTHLGVCKPFGCKDKDLRRSWKWSGCHRQAIMSKMKWPVHLLCYLNVLRAPPTPHVLFTSNLRHTQN